MTTVVSRLYDQVENRHQTRRQALRAKEFPDSTLSVITEPDATAMMAPQGPPRQRRAL